MKDQHPGSELLERFLDDALSPDERRAVVRHLLTGCAECTAITGRLWKATGGPEPVRRRRSAAPPPVESPSPHLVGRIEVAEDRPGEAEAAFLAARDGFLALGAGRDAALVSLDLALLYLRQGRNRELQGLAGELYPIFAACDMQREAILSLLVFRGAVESETASTELVCEIARYLGGFAVCRRAR